MGLIEKHKTLVQLIRKGRALKFLDFTGPIEHHDIIRVVEKYDSARVVIAIVALEPFFTEFEICSIDNLGINIKNDANARAYPGDHGKKIMAVQCCSFHVRRYYCNGVLWPQKVI
jgi:hypothetical protein